MEISEVCSALSNATRLNLVSIVSNRGSLTSKRAHELFTSQYEQRRRQSIHAALKTLVEAEILEKSYNREDGGIVYTPEISQLIIDLDSMTIEAN